VLLLYFFAYVHATLQLVVKVFKLLHAVNGLAACDALE
jgi:hypothetical protein